MDYRTTQIAQTDESDSCAIVAFVKKDGVPTHGNVRRTLMALDAMEHRTGEINFESDGAGIQTDIPRKIWEKTLAVRRMNASLAYDPYFTVAHLMIRRSAPRQVSRMLKHIFAILSDHGFEVIFHQKAKTMPEYLGPKARAAEPLFYQIACLPARFRVSTDRQTFLATLAIEHALPSVHVASFSKNSVIYKVRGDTSALMRYFPELRHPDFRSAISLAHGRYSTNTDSEPQRAQMFSTLGHNGEINTIRRLEKEARQLGFQLVPGGSDSQNLDRILESFMFAFDLSLMEAMEILFPPTWSEVKRLPERFHSMYAYFRRAWGMLAQGPAAVIARQSNEIVFSVDALGLRPLWFGETEKEYFASSEKGVVDLDNMQTDPKPLAPGEKMGFLLHRQTMDPNSEGRWRPGFVEIFSYDKIQQRALRTFEKRIGSQIAARGIFRPQAASVRTAVFSGAKTPEKLLAASGWKREDLAALLEMATTGREPIGSTGYDGPLAGFAPLPVNLPEFFKEKVAVVTNPAIDRIRESQHFSTAVFLGGKPSLKGENTVPAQVFLNIPLVLSSMADSDFPELSTAAAGRSVATLKQIEALASEELFVSRIPLTSESEKPLNEHLEDLHRQVDEIVSEHTSTLLILSDRDFLRKPKHTLLDPFVALASLDDYLHRRVEKGESLRRRVSLILHSAQLRNIHDIMVALGLGADAVSPYLAIQKVLENFSANPLPALDRFIQALQSGMEEVLSTLGIYDLNGYERLFSAIGLGGDLAQRMHVPHFCGSKTAGFGLDRLALSNRERQKILLERERRLRPEGHFYSRLTKKIHAVASEKENYASYDRLLAQLEQTRPISLRHLLRFKPTPRPISRDQVDITIHDYDAPVYFAAMSYGSLSESMFRAVAEAAYRLNILAMNGEGGELPEILGHYRHHRGQQVASGRFGVNASMLNSVDTIEIKVGQGAKPGEGGMLPARKVTAEIARARHTPAGIDLISPSNNHDVYSIEDLAQLVEELKTINPHARISVKIPAIPGIGTIASGIAKSGADIIDISGYDGGTGAARQHALKYVGFPIEIAVKEAHESLIRNQLRRRVEIWADGGMKSAADVLKLILLGANRVGFGTLLLLAAGCLRCHSCHTGTCEVGITSHFKTEKEALASGLKRFTFLQTEQATDRIVAVFSELLTDLRTKTGQIGLFKLQEGVGRCDLLEQIPENQAFDLTRLLRKSYSEAWRTLDLSKNGKSTLIRRPRTSLTRIISNSVCRAFDKGDRHVVYFDDEVSSMDRAIGTYLSGKMHRLPARIYPETHHAIIQLVNGTVPGNGLGSFTTESIEIHIAGGAQDGTAKCASGGKIVILKGKNHDGKLIDGSVGKYFAYGAQRGTFIVQGNADVRAGIRLSGADVIIGGELKSRLKDNLGNWATRANIKGFAFEYMTSGRGLVLGDPGPWLCSGMKGGVIYFRLYPKLGLTPEALTRRLANPAEVHILPVDESDGPNLTDLLTRYYEALVEGNLFGEARRVKFLLKNWEIHFAKAVPVSSSHKAKLSP